MDIQPQVLSLHRLLTGRLFRIPQYQRAYSWTAKQRNDLFSDLEKIAHRPGSSHFMATVVGLRRENRSIKTDEFHVVEVVDGQQRLTTLVILLKAIENVLGETDETEQSVAHELRSLLVKADAVAPVLLQTNHDSNEHCSTYLREGKHPAAATATTLADRRLLEAMEDCERFVAKWQTEGHSIIDLVALVKNRLNFILHEINDESLVYTVFEVLNSRGLDVSWFDRLKSILMGIAFEADGGNARENVDELHRIWREIYDCVGLRQGMSTEALRFAATLRSPSRPNRPLSEEDSVGILRVASNSSPKGVINVSNWVLKVTKAVDALHADRRRHGATDIAQARLLAVSILIRDDLAASDRSQLLASWEKVSFRIYGMFGKDARTKVGDYVRLAWRCATQRPVARDLLDGIRELGVEYPIDEAVEELRDTDCYTDWQSHLRYFLFRYEERLAKKHGQTFDNEQWNRIWLDTPARSIEHVYPQSKGSPVRTAKGVVVHRLGNLVLLPPGLNIRLGAKDPVEKKAEYLKTGLAIAVDVAERIPAWNRAAIEKREEELLAWARLEWAD